MSKFPREDYRKLARRVNFARTLGGDAAHGYVCPTTYDSLPPLPRSGSNQINHLFSTPPDTLEAYETDIRSLIHLCDICPAQYPAQSPTDLAWTLEVLNSDEAQRLQKVAGKEAKAGDFYLRMRTGSFTDFAKLQYALTPDNAYTADHIVARRVAHTAMGVERPQTDWAKGVRRSLTQAKVPFEHSSEPDGTQKFKIEGAHSRPALILKGMLHFGAFDGVSTSKFPPAIKPVYARLPQNFGDVTLAQVQETRRNAESRKLAWLRPALTVDTYRSPD